VDFPADGDRVDRPWIAAQSCEGPSSTGAAAVHGLPTLIHRLPTLPRGGIGRACQRIRNKKFLNFGHIGIERFG
jgi:hypothetical protein